MKTTKNKKNHLEAEKSHLECLRLKHQTSVDWGWSRLMNIIQGSPSKLHDRMSRQQMLLSQSIGRVDYKDIEKHSQGMMRGISACVKYAVDNGFEKLSPSIWSCRRGNKDIILVENDEELSRAVQIAEKDNVLYFTVNELLDLLPDDAFQVKTKFSDVFGGETTVGKAEF